MAVLAVLIIPSAGMAATTQVDALIEKLVEKGILDKKEAVELKAEIVQDERTVQEDHLKTTLPEWVQNTKLKGDFRLRHEYSKRNDSTDLDRNRGRLRYRLGLETKINDKVIVGAGIASNGGSPRSTNQSFADTFSKSSFNLDYAYAQYTPNDYVTLTGGKMKIPFWEPADLLWDTDITPEGGAINLNYKVNDNFKLIANAGAFVLDEISSDLSDPFMFMIQPGIEWKNGESSDYKVAMTYTNFDNGTKQLLDNRSSPTTNMVTGGRYDFTYNTISVGQELGINNLFDSAIPRVALIGEYVNNPDADNQNSGWLAGFYLGDRKVAGPGQWKITGTYRYLGRDAWLDALPDSDFYGGATDVKGYKTILEYGLAKNVSVAIDYYRTERIKTTKAPETVLQTDINFKF